MNGNIERWSLVTRYLAEASDEEIAPDEIRRSTSLSEDLDLGSLQVVTLVMDLEDELGITISDEELESLTGTVGDVFDLIEEKLGAQRLAQSA